VARFAVLTVVAVASLIVSVYALWARYIAVQEEMGAVQHENSLEEYSQELTGLKLCLEFGFLLEVSTSLLARTDEFLDAEAKAELDLEATLKSKVSKGLIQIEASLIAEATSRAKGAAAITAIEDVFRGENGVQDVVRDAVRGFQGHVAVVKADTLQKTERVLWEQADVWNGLQHRLLQLVARLRGGAKGHPEREKMVVSTGMEGVRGRAGLGRYMANFFANLALFEDEYKRKRKRVILSIETRGELERLRGGINRPGQTEAVISPAQIERVEAQLREVIAASGLPAYVSTRFDHQLGAYLNDVLFVDHILRLRNSDLRLLRDREAATSESDVSERFSICTEVMRLVGLRKVSARLPLVCAWRVCVFVLSSPSCWRWQVPIRWLVDPHAMKATRWPSVDHFDIRDVHAIAADGAKGGLRTTRR